MNNQHYTSISLLNSKNKYLYFQKDTNQRKEIAIFMNAGNF